MQPIFELWDIETGNLVDAYMTEEAALADVLHTLAADGIQSVETLALLRDDQDGAPLTPIARHRTRGLCAHDAGTLNHGLILQGHLRGEGDRVDEAGQ